MTTKDTVSYLKDAEGPKDVCGEPIIIDDVISMLYQYRGTPFWRGGFDLWGFEVWFVGTANYLDLEDTLDSIVDLSFKMNAVLYGSYYERNVNQNIDEDNLRLWIISCYQRWS